MGSRWIPFARSMWLPIEQMPGSKPTIKQKLAAIRMLYDFLVVRQVVPSNPTASVRGPKYVVKRGKTPVWNREDAKKLLESIPRDRPLASPRQQDRKFPLGTPEPYWPASNAFRSTKIWKPSAALTVEERRFASVS
jgi:hypothetical protein